jgi:hypothetical protein
MTLARVATKREVTLLRFVGRALQGGLIERGLDLGRRRRRCLYRFGGRFFVLFLEQRHRNSMARATSRRAKTMAYLSA